MDPDANYREQELIYLRIMAGVPHPGDHGRLKALVAALRGWVNNGGFKPRGYIGPAWKPPKAPPKSEGQKIGERRYKDAKRRLIKKLGRQPTTGEMARNLYDRFMARGKKG